MKTFYDIIEIISKRKEEGKKVCCYASHSNSKSLCDVSRNLDDDQLKKIKEVGGLVGVVTVKNFLIDGEIDIDNDADYRRAFFIIVDIVGIYKPDYTFIVFIWNKKNIFIRNITVNKPHTMKS